MNRRPALSVVIPCFGALEHLKETLGSVIETEIKNLEVLLVDDGNPEPLLPRFEALSRDFPNLALRFFRQTNGGPAKGRNTGIKNACSELVLTLDSDDKLVSGQIPRLLKTLQTEPGIDIVYGDIVRFGDANDRWPAVSHQKLRLTHTNGVPYSAVFRKQVWITVGGYNEEVPYGVEDWQFWMHAQFRGARFRHLPGPALLYRVRGGTLTSKVNANDLLTKAAIIKSLPEAFLPVQLRWAEAIFAHRDLSPKLSAQQGARQARVGVMPNEAAALIDLALLAGLTGQHEKAAEYFQQFLQKDDLPSQLRASDDYAQKLEGLLVSSGQRFSWLRRLKVGLFSKTVSA